MSPGSPAAHIGSGTFKSHKNGAMEIWDIWAKMGPFWAPGGPEGTQYQVKVSGDQESNQGKSQILPFLDVLASMEGPFIIVLLWTQTASSILSL